jgi:hypothetical protein
MKTIQTAVPGYIRDVSTNVILNQNLSELHSYHRERDRCLEQEEVKRKVESLDQSLTEIKTLLQALVYNKNG